MAGKSNKGRNRRGSHNAVNSSEPVVSSDVPLNDNLSRSEPSKSNSNGKVTMSESISTQSEVKQSENANSENQTKQGDFNFPDLFICILAISQPNISIHLWL